MSSFGIKTKKEIRTWAPPGAEWSDLSGDVFYKISDGVVYFYAVAAARLWHISSMKPDMFSETYFHRLKRKSSK